MPIREYRCPSCYRTEERFFQRASADATLQCPKCNVHMPRAISLPARVGESFWSEQAGCRVEGKGQEEQMMKQKGFTRLTASEFDELADRYTEQRDIAIRKQDKINDEYNDLVTKHGGDKEAASGEMYTAERFKAGDFDTGY